VHRRKVELGRFVAKTDKGKEYIIIKYQDYISERNFNGEVFEIEDLLDFRTTNGFHVNSIDSKTFEIVETNDIVQKV
jgi:hypothetical protein